MVDICYEFICDFCEKVLKKFGVLIIYYDFMFGEGICELI